MAGPGVANAGDVWAAGGEVVLVWATDIPSQTRLRQNRDAARGLCDEGEPDERLVAWDRRSAEYVTGGDSHIMTPLPRTVYGPEEWEDASLEDWLASAKSNSVR